MIPYSLFFALIVPGFIAMLVYEKMKLCPMRAGYRFIIKSLIFDLFILAIMLAGLYLFKGIYTVVALMIYFNCLSFTIKYILISVVVGIILAVICGLISRCRCFRCHSCKT